MEIRPISSSPADSPDGGTILELSMADLLALAGADERRETLLIQLVYAARDLAARNIVADTRIAADMAIGAVIPGWCRECQMNAVAGTLVHGSTCATGRVLRIIAELSALRELDLSKFAFKSTGKEAALETEDGNAGAGDGIRPRGLTYDRVCMKCGRGDGQWLAEACDWPHFDLATLGRNQCVEPRFDGQEGCVVHTHLCESCLQIVAGKAGRA